MSSAAVGTAAQGADADAPGAGKEADAMLSVTALAAGYGDRLVLSELDLTVAPCVALRVRGRNGSGKSTLLRCLAGAHPLRAGRVLVAGHDLEGEPLRAKAGLGYADGTCPFPYLTGREHLTLTRRVYGLSAGRVDNVLEQFPSWACRGVLDRQLRTYSRGMRQQLSLLLAVAHGPRLLLLDEVVDGLDDEALGDWTAFLGRHLDAGGSAVLVEHRDQHAQLLHSTRSLVLPELPEAPHVP